MRGDVMTFPETVEEFMEEYKIVDTEKVYTNGIELVPIFRMKQWFEHLPSGRQEMSAVEYLRTMRLICEDGRNCGKCPLSYNNNGAGINCQDYAAYHPDEAVAIVEAWAKEHPERSEE